MINQVEDTVADLKSTLKELQTSTLALEQLKNKIRYKYEWR